MITLALVTAMKKSELLNLTWGDIDFEEHIVFVSPKQDADETWEWKIKDTDCRLLPLSVQLNIPAYGIGQTGPPCKTLRNGRSRRQ